MTIKKNIRVLRNPLETGAFVAGMALVPWLPRGAVLKLATGLGRAAFRLDVRSRRIAQANLRTVLPQLCEAGNDAAIVGEAFRVFALTALDLYWFGRHPAERLRKYVVFDPSFKPYFEYSPLIAVCAHYGNWEVLGQAVALAGAPSVSVAAPLRNHFVDRRVRQLRTRTGQQLVSSQGAARSLLRALRQQQRIALLLDQNTRPRQGGVWTPFFGLPVPVSGIVELLAERTDTPVLSVYGCPQPEGYYRAVADPVRMPQTTPRGSETLTAALMQDLETRVRQNPAHWLWMYKRWKYIAPGQSPDRYPFYSRSC